MGSILQPEASTPPRTSSPSPSTSAKRATNAKPIRSRFRCTTILPFVCTVVAFALTLVVLIAGTKRGTLEGYELMSLNTSKIGQNVVQFTPVTSTASAPRPSASTGSSAINNGLNGIGDFFGNIINNITAGVDGTLNNAEAQLVKGITARLGIQEQYSFYLRSICSGTLANRSSAGCTTYDDKNAALNNLTNMISSSFVIGTTNISIPLLGAVSSAGGYITDLSKTFSVSIFAFYIVSLVCSAIVAILSTALGLSFFKHIRLTKTLVHTTMSVSLIGITFHLIASIAMSSIAGLANSVVNSFGNSLGVQSKAGVAFLALTWSAWVLELLAGWYWISVWFVEVRTYAVKARYRTSREMGNYRGVFKEVINDLRRPKEMDLVRDQDE